MRVHVDCAFRQIRYCVPSSGIIDLSTTSFSSCSTQVARMPNFCHPCGYNCLWQDISVSGYLLLGSRLRSNLTCCKIRMITGPSNFKPKLSLRQHINMVFRLQNHGICIMNPEVQKSSICTSPRARSMTCSWQCKSYSQALAISVSNFQNKT